MIADVRFDGWYSLYFLSDGMNHVYATDNLYGHIQIIYKATRQRKIAKTQETFQPTTL